MPPTPVPTVRRLTPEALDACLRTHFYTTLSACLMLIGVDQKYLEAETLSTKIVGRIARMRGLTPEWLCELVDWNAASGKKPPPPGRFW